MRTKIANARLIMEDGILEGKYVYTKDGMIEAVTDKELPCSRVIDGEGMYLSPGFVDLHVHGAKGHDFTDGNVEGVIEAANFHCKNGTTTIYPTTLAASFEVTVKALETLRQAINSGEITAHVPGIHMEGPYFSKKQCGAQNTSYITPPVKKEYQYILENYGDMVARWSFAPELPGAEQFIKDMKQYGVMASAGHTDATYDDMLMAYENGLRMITHFYSCISSITRDKGFRILGVMECGYLWKDMVVEAIADGCHVPKELFRMLYQIKGVENICLVTDAICMTGSESEVGMSGGVPCKIAGGVAKLMDESAFAGSVATTGRLIQFCVKEVGIPIWDAVKMGTTNPAKTMGLEKVGKIAEGYQADLVVLDDEIRVRKVFVSGEEV